MTRKDGVEVMDMRVMRGYGTNCIFSFDSALDFVVLVVVRLLVVCACMHMGDKCIKL